MKKTRQLHLWIGLLSSVLIFIQATTGLLMLEPWLIGQSQMQRGSMSGNMETPKNPNINPSNPQDSTNQHNPANIQGGQNTAPNMNVGPNGFEQSSILGIIKNIHEGRIGGTNIRIIGDIVAISLIFLTVTGITLSIRTLRTKKRKPKTNPPT